MMVGSAAALACDESIRRGQALAAQHLEAALDDVHFQNGLYTVAGTDRSGLQSLIPLPEAFGNVLDDVATPARNEEPIAVDPFFGAHERGRLKTEIKPRASAMSIG